LVIPLLEWKTTTSQDSDLERSSKQHGFRFGSEPVYLNRFTGFDVFIPLFQSDVSSFPWVVVERVIIFKG